MTKPAGPIAPKIPCAKCGESLPYDQAIPAHIDEGHLGFIHPNNVCKMREARKVGLDRAAR